MASAEALRAPERGSAGAPADSALGFGGLAAGEGEGRGRRTLTRFCATRVLWKVALAGMLYVGYTSMDLAQHLEDGAAWIETQDPQMAFLSFLLLATCFTAVSPTGYLPTVLAGAVFHRSRLEAWAVAYAQVRPAPRPAPTPPNSRARCLAGQPRSAAQRAAGAEPLPPAGAAPDAAAARLLPLAQRRARAAGARARQDRRARAHALPLGWLIQLPLRCACAPSRFARARLSEP